jgi:hypothetical protein
MRRLVLGEARSVIGRVIGKCSTNADVATYANEAQERLLNRPNDPVGSWMRYKVCVGSDAVLVWPRQIRTIKAFAICNTPGIVRTDHFEFIGYNEGGIGLQDSDSMPGKMLIDHGTACSFDNVISTTAEPRKIQVVAADASDNGKKVILRYIDSNGNRVYTTINGTVQEGEEITLSTSGALTSSNVATNGLYHVVKATTNHPVRLYSYDVNSAVQSTLLAVYEPSETVPIYRRTLIPGLTNMAACPDASSDCTVNKSVTILAKLQHIPVVADNDPFVIGNLPALKDMVQSILMCERHEYQAAELLEAKAARELDGEIASYLGDGAAIALKFQDTELSGAGGIMNAI